MSLLTPAVVGALKFALAASALALLAWEMALRRRGRADAFARQRNALLLVLGLASGLGWWNFLALAYVPGFGHSLEIYHYYIGAKYFDELGYTRLYECTTVAEAEFGSREQAARRSIRNLETYRRESASIILGEPGRCTRHFSPERWQTFKRDVAWFRARIPEGLWQGALADHGYNPTPAWGAMAHAFIRSGPVSERDLAPVLFVDPILLLLMWAFVWRAFGWRAACVGLVFWGTNMPADYVWTGGALLRQVWLTSLVIGICCLHMRRFAAGGFLLGVSALLRVFPAVAIAAIAASAAVGLWRRRRFRPEPEYARIAAGVVAAAALLVPLSFAVAGGPAAWVAFAEHIALHASTLFAANVGLRIFLVGVLGSVHGTILAVAALAYLALLVRAVDGEEPWSAAAIGTGAVVVLTTISSYYYGLLLCFALLWLRRQGVGVLLCALSASGWCVAWGFERTDQIYAWLSLATVVCVFAMTALMICAPKPRDRVAPATAALPAA